VEFYWCGFEILEVKSAGHKRFAKIVVCGEGELVKTILEHRYSAVGSEVE